MNKIKRNIISNYICPEIKTQLTEFYDSETKEITHLQNEKGKVYSIVDGIFDLTYPKKLSTKDSNVKQFYDARVEAYDDNLHLTFDTHGENETVLRNSFIDKLNLKKNSKVLEIACGTGRDSEIIAQRLDKKGALYCQDISHNMLKKCREKLNAHNINKEFCISNAMHLPYPDNFFDSTYSFGAIGEFSDIKKSLEEIVRVTKVGGKIVIGDESIPVWLRNTDFSKILITTNPQFSASVPLPFIPVEARNLVLRWVIGGVFYLIDFEVGDGEPTANFDIPIPGERGGTYRTRYEGALEGITKETKELAYKAIRENNIDMHSWLDKVVRLAAESELKK